MPTSARHSRPAETARPPEEHSWLHIKDDPSPLRSDAQHGGPDVRESRACAHICGLQAKTRSPSLGESALLVMGGQCICYIAQVAFRSEGHANCRIVVPHVCPDRANTAQIWPSPGQFRPIFCPNPSTLVEFGPDAPLIRAATSVKLDRNRPSSSGRLWPSSGFLVACDASALRGMSWLQTPRRDSDGSSHGGISAGSGGATEALSVGMGGSQGRESQILSAQRPWHILGSSPADDAQ